MQLGRFRCVNRQMLRVGHGRTRLQLCRRDCHAQRQFTSAGFVRKPRQVLPLAVVLASWLAPPSAREATAQPPPTTATPSPPTATTAETRTPYDPSRDPAWASLSRDTAAATVVEILRHKPQTDRERCALAIAYSYLDSLEAAARATSLLVDCESLANASAPIVVGGGLTRGNDSNVAFASPHRAHLSRVAPLLQKRLRASNWSEISLTSNVDRDRVVLEAWPEIILVAPLQVWLAPGTYRAQFAGTAQPERRAAPPLVRDFTVASKSRSIVIAEHPKQPSEKRTNLDFSEEQTTASNPPTVIINDQHKPLLPDRFVAPSDSSGAIASATAEKLDDPFADAQKSWGTWSAGLRVGAGIFTDAKGASRFGGQGALTLVYRIDSRFALGLEAGGGHLGGNDNGQSLWAAHVAVGPRFRWAGRYSTPFFALQLAADLRFGTRTELNRVGLALCPEFGFMVGANERIGLAFVGVLGLTAVTAADNAVAAALVPSLRVRF